MEVSKDAQLVCNVIEDIIFNCEHTSTVYLKALSFAFKNYPEKAAKHFKTITANLQTNFNQSTNDSTLILNYLIWNFACQKMGMIQCTEKLLHFILLQTIEYAIQDSPLQKVTSSLNKTMVNFEVKLSTPAQVWSEFFLGIYSFLFGKNLSNFAELSVSSQAESLLQQIINDPTLTNEAAFYGLLGTLCYFSIQTSKVTMNSKPEQNFNLSNNILVDCSLFNPGFESTKIGLINGHNFEVFLVQNFTILVF
ncbi:MAG: hypothetical protein MHPSP_000624 [Paramarteilia canceri]